MDCCLERLAVDFPQKSWRRVAVGAVDAALGVVEGQKMLGHALRAPSRGLGASDAACISGAEGGSQGRVLAVALALTAHAGVAGDVQHRGEDLRDAAGGLLTADGLGDLFLQVRVPARTPGDPGGKAGRILNEGAAEALHVEDGGDAVRGLCNHDLLHSPLPGRTFLQRLDPPQLQRTDLTDAVKRLRRDPVHVLRQFPKGEHAAHLCHLLVQAQVSEQRLGALFRRKGLICPESQIHSLRFRSYVVRRSACSLHIGSPQAR